MSDAKEWKWLYKSYILKLFSDSRKESLRLYKRFVLQETPEEINRIFGRNKLPSVLGSREFIDGIKGRFFSLEDFEEIPEARRLAPDTDKIKLMVCRAYNINDDDLYSSRRGYFNEPRNVAVYLTRHLRNDTLKEVGVQFNIRKSSSVSSIVERMKSGLKADRGLRMRIEELAESIIKSQEPT
jgi:hypothetical protein